jgi:PPM family protein phosphatase
MKPMSTTIKPLYAGKSDPGRVRRNNEDQVLVDADRGIYLVVDGLGGHNAGERAAEVAVQLVTKRLARQIGTIEERVVEAVTLANNEILELAKQESGLRGMACVLTLVVLDGTDAVVGHVGDSRLYELTPGAIRKITRDHSPVGELEDNRMLSEAEAMRHPRRNEVYRDVGSELRAPGDRDWVEVHRFPFRDDMALLLCSDGLSDQVNSDDIRKTVERFAASPEQAVLQLIDAANRAGGKDNVSVILIEGPRYPSLVVKPSDSAVVTPARPIAVSKPRFGFLVPFLAGLVLATLAAIVMQPHVEVTPQGRQLKFGPVVIPTTLEVGRQRSYKTLNAALDVARPGDTVLVDPDVYKETLRMREGVRIVSRDRHAALLEGADTLVSAANLKSGSLEGFRLVGEAAGTAVGVLIENSDVHLIDLRISGTTVAAISVQGKSNPRILGSRILNHSGAAVAIAGNSRPVLSYNVLAPGRGGGGPAIEVKESALPILEDNVIRENGGRSISAPPPLSLDTLKQTNVFVPAPSPKPPATSAPRRSTPPVR